MDNQEKPKKADFSLIMPVYNEAGVIEEVIKDLYVIVIKKKPDSKFIIMEDGSDDGTKDILKKLNQKIPFMLVSGKNRKGYTKAFKDALKMAKTEFIFFSDSDGQHNPCDVLRMLNEIDGFDIVSGYKYPRRDPFYRLVMSKIYNFLFFVLFGLKMKDINSGFKLIRKNVVDDILSDIQDMQHCVMSEFIIKSFLSGYKIKEIGVEHFPRKHGSTNIFNPAKLPFIIAGVIKSLVRIKLNYRKDQHR